MKKLIILCVAMLAMASCNTLKTYQKSQTEQMVNTENLYGEGLNGDSLGLGDLKWRDLFTDPRLQSIIEKVLTQNPKMLDADLKIQELEYALHASKMAFAPTVNLNLNGGINKMWDTYNRTDQTIQKMTSSVGKTYGIGLTVGWQQVNILQLRNAKKGAEISKQQMQYSKQAIQAALVANTAKLYYSLAELDEKIALMEKTKANWSKYLEMEKNLMAAGQANLAAVSSIEATYWSICQSLVLMKDNAKIVENSLTTLMNEKPTHDIERGALTTFQAPGIVSAGAPISILARRPDVRVAEMTYASKFYSVNSARSAFYPSLTLTATGSFTNSAGTSVINPGIFVANAAAALAQPILANGRLTANLKVSKNELQVAQNDFVNTVISAGNEVNTAMLEVKNAEELKGLIANEVKALEIAYDATDKLYRNTSANYINVIISHNQLLSAKVDQITNRMDAIEATIELYQALGGGAE